MPAAAAIPWGWLILEALLTSGAFLAYDEIAHGDELEPGEKAKLELEKQKMENEREASTQLRKDEEAEKARVEKAAIEAGKAKAITTNLRDRQVQMDKTDTYRNAAANALARADQLQGPMSPPTPIPRGDFLGID